jgi:hypothetical protein
MRAALLALAAALGGCQLLLGIDDPVGDQCSPFDVDSCDPTDTCDRDPDDGRLTCRMEGTVPAGELCFEPDDCAGPLSCVDGVCRTFCPVFGDDCPDPAEGECIKIWGSSHVCDSACDPIANTGCIPDAECILSTNDNGAPIAVCVPHGYFGAKMSGETCDFLEQCVPGFTCQTGTCRALCENGTTCATGPCVARFDTLHGVQTGVCPP